MIRMLLFPLFLAGMAWADTGNDILDTHVLPGFDRLEARTQALSAMTDADCGTASAPLRGAFTDAVKAWTAVSHLRFGPTEAENRSFALAFWPDNRGLTPKALTGLILTQDQAVSDSTAFAQVSVAARGLYALEYLLFDDRIATAGTAEYRCALIRAVAADGAGLARDMAADWHDRYAALMRSPGPGGTYQSEAEVLQEFFKALGTGLQMTAELRLGRPLGTYDKPRPLRTEMWRSGLSLDLVRTALTSQRELALLLAKDDADLQMELAAKFDLALETASRIDDPTLAGVANPSGRVRIEALQQRVNEIREAVAKDLGPKLGVSAGFNSLDGD